MAAKLEQRTLQVPLRNDGSLRVAIVADTHSAPSTDGLRHLRALAPDLILHAGDIGEVAVLRALGEIAPVYAVRGNIDSRVHDLPDVLVLQFENQGERALTAVLMHIAVAGLKIRNDAAKLARMAKASLIVCGHSHVPFVTQEGGLTLFNPGSIGPRRFRLPIVFGVMNIGLSGVTLRHFDCESGGEWRP